GAGQAPEAVCVAADPVDDQERYAVLVLDVGRLHHADRLLDLIAPREIGAERPMHHLDVPGLHLLDGVVAPPADTPLHDLAPLASPCCPRPYPARCRLRAARRYATARPRASCRRPSRWRRRSRAARTPPSPSRTSCPSAGASRA